MGKEVRRGRKEGSEARGVRKEGREARGVSWGREESGEKRREKR
jgi:hypothetical protein